MKTQSDCGVIHYFISEFILWTRDLGLYCMVSTEHFTAVTSRQGIKLDYNNELKQFSYFANCRELRSTTLHLVTS